VVGLATGPLGGGPIETHGELRESRAWSTMKVPVIVAAIATGRADWDAIDAAITRSDNDAALLLWHGLDDGAAQVETVSTGRRGLRDQARARARPARLQLVRPDRVVASAAVRFYGRWRATSCFRPARPAASSAP